MPTAELERRGLLATATDRAGLDAVLRARPAVPVVASFDVVELEARHLVTAVMLRRLQAVGHRPVIVLRGVAAITSGTPRDLAVIQTGLRRLLDFDDPATGAIVVDDAERLSGLGYLEFLRDVGKYLTVNYLTDKPSLKARTTLSYTELAQLVIDAYDFVELAAAYGCRVKLGDASQLDAISAGCDLAARMSRPPLFGFVAPELDNRLCRSGTDAPIELDPKRTPPFRFYQHWLNVGDDDAPRLLRAFSPRPLAELDELLAEHDRDRARRVAQRELTRALTSWVHGDAALANAIAASRVMFGEALDGLTDADLGALADIVPTIELARGELEGGISIVDLIVRAFSETKGAARRLVTQGGAYVNNLPIKDVARIVTLDDLATETMLVVASGRKNRRLVRVI